MRGILIAVLLVVFASDAAVADDAFPRGTLGNLVKVDPKLNSWYRGENDPGKRYEIVARAYINPNKPTGSFISQTGNVAARIDLSAIDDVQLASLRDQCPEYIFCIGRWSIEITPAEDKYGLMIVKLYSWRR